MKLILIAWAFCFLSQAFGKEMKQVNGCTCYCPMDHKEKSTCQKVDFPDYSKGQNQGHKDGHRSRHRSLSSKSSKSSKRTKKVSRKTKFTKKQIKRIHKAARSLETKVHKMGGSRFLFGNPDDPHIKCGACIGDIANILGSCQGNVECTMAQSGKCFNCVCMVSGLLNLPFLSDITNLLCAGLG